LNFSNPTNTQERDVLSIDDTQGQWLIDLAVARRASPSIASSSSKPAKPNSLSVPSNPISLNQPSITTEEISK
jgi:hypothetical protein